MVGKVSTRSRSLQFPFSWVLHSFLGQDSSSGRDQEEEESGVRREQSVVPLGAELWPERATF